MENWELNLIANQTACFIKSIVFFLSPFVKEPANVSETQIDDWFVRNQKRNEIIPIYIFLFSKRQLSN